MYTVKSERREEKFETLDDAMQYAKVLGILVEITTPTYQIVGKFGVDSIEEGKCPDGIDYTWRKRRA